MPGDTRKAIHKHQNATLLGSVRKTGTESSFSYQGTVFSCNDTHLISGIIDLVAYEVPFPLTLNRSKISPPYQVHIQQI
jgi:hypothetical protein